MDDELFIMDETENNDMLLSFYEMKGPSILINDEKLKFRKILPRKRPDEFSSSEDYNKYIQRRLQNNASARETHKKKIYYYKSIEIKNDCLNEENKQLKERIKQLEENENENKLLKEKIERLENELLKKK